MARALLTLVFMLVLLCWLQWEFRRKTNLTRYWLWIAAALAVQLLSGVLFELIGGVAGNFVYHAVGGGILSTLLFVYLLKTYSVRVSWRAELVLLFAFVSALGALNELAEYAAEFLYLGAGVLSWDGQDTWRDLVANTLGAVAAWGMYRISFLRAGEPQAKRPGLK